MLIYKFIAFFIGLHQFGDWGLLALRLALGAIFLVHGFKKLALWRARPGSQLGPGMLALMRFLSIAEPLGGLAMVLGWFTQLASVGLSLIMIGAIYFKIVMMKKKFSTEGGWEFDLIILAAAIALYFLGAGGLSLDRLIFGL